MTTRLENAPAIASPPQPIAAAGPGFSVADGVRMVKTILRHHWLNIITCLVLSGLIAFGAAQVLGEDVWEAKGIMLFRPLAIPEQQKDLYTPPSVKTLMGYATDPTILKKLIEDNNLKVPSNALEKSIVVEEPMGTENVTVSMKWGNPNEVEKMADQLMELFTDKVVSTRKVRLEGQIDDTKRMLGQVNTRLTTSRGKLTKIYEEKKIIVDSKSEREQLSKDIQDIKKELDTLGNTEQTARVALDALPREIEDLKKGAGAEGEKKAEEIKLQLESADETNKLQQLKVQLERKTQELENNRRLYAQRAIPREKLDAVEDEVKKLDNEMKFSTTASGLKKRIADAEKAEGVSSTTSKKTTELEKKLLEKYEKQRELELAKWKIERLKERHTEKLAILVGLNQVQSELESLEKEVETNRVESQRLSKQLDDLQNLATINTKEFQIVTKATCGPSPASSTRTRVMAMFLMGCLAVSVVGISLYEVGFRPPTGEELAKNMGLPVLAHGLPIGKADYGPAATESRLPDSLRGFSLRLRQYVPQPGAVLLFSSMNDGNEIEPLLGDLSLNFAQRHERVLILDARIDQGQGEVFSRLTNQMFSAGAPSANGQGLVPYLTKGQADESGGVTGTLLSGVKLLPSGGPYFVQDVLASQRMRDLLDRCRKQYTLILIGGPRVDSAVDVEILASYVDGVVFTMNGQRRPFAQAGECIRSLQQANAPVLGAAVCARVAVAQGARVDKKKVGVDWKGGK